MPTGMPAMPQPPSMPAPPLPPIQRTVPPEERQPADKIQNAFERWATLIVDHAQDQAQRLADNMSGPPADSRELSPEDIKARWYYSPAGNATAADALFWQTHDQVLAQTGDHAQAEQQAFQAAYPKRLPLVGSGVAAPEVQVKQAEQARKLVDGEQAPDSAQVATSHAYHGQMIRQSGGSV